ncbi:MAG: hypothetical protein SGJ20_19685 [Planctomycetota bacterium]|nr:hypothetical protein [Planctomycetota bacterium]
MTNRIGHNLPQSPPSQPAFVPLPGFAQHQAGFLAAVQQRAYELALQELREREFRKFLDRSLFSSMN